MKKVGLFLLVFLLPNTLFAYDYFITANCTGLAGYSGEIDTARLSSCFNDLINGINETRRKLDDGNNQTHAQDVKVDSAQVIDSIFAQMEKEIAKHNEETESKIKQLEDRISTLEELLSNFTDEARSSGQTANK